MGVFSALYALESRGLVSSDDFQWYRETEEWLNDHLPVPKSLARARKKGAKRVAVTWIKSTATAHVARLREIAEYLRSKDIEVVELRSSRPGYIVYEDEFQVAAEPFADTEA